jgi:hypothetical protein
MRMRHWSSVALLFLLIWTGAGCRDSGITAGATVVQAFQSPAASPVPLPNKDGSLKFSVHGSKTGFPGFRHIPVCALSRGSVRSRIG